MLKLIWVRILFDMNFEKWKLNLLDTDDDSDDSDDRDENEDPVEYNGLIIDVQLANELRRMELTTENSE